MTDKNRYPIATLILRLFGEMMATGKPVELEPVRSSNKTDPKHVVREKVTASSLGLDSAWKLSRTRSRETSGVRPSHVPTSRAGKATAGS
ncbi:MAG: hypothetical protein WCT31_02795 [Candidatus Micrarchaeia archaeon]|jgi:hypothetical protein